MRVQVVPGRQVSHGGVVYGQGAVLDMDEHAAARAVAAGNVTRIHTKVVVPSKPAGPAPGGQARTKKDA